MTQYSPEFFRKYADLITEAEKSAEILDEMANEIDPQATQQWAEKIMAALKDNFTFNYFTKRPNKDGSITFTKDDSGPLDPYNPAYDDPSNKGVLTGKNISKVLEPFYTSFRQQGWTFTQPVMGSFTIAVPPQPK